MAPVTHLRRCELHTAYRGDECPECATKDLHELAREVLAHRSTAFMVPPVRRIVEAVASFPITSVRGDA